jgi:hypothetical protein
MLDHARDTGTRQSLQHRPPQRGHAQRFVPQRAVADHIMCTFLLHI